MTLVDLRGQHDDPAVRGLLEPSRTWILIGWEDEGSLVACAGVEREGNEIALRSIAVAPERRGRGFGRALVDSIAGVATADRLVAEAPGDSAGFLLRCGFMPEPAGGRERYVRAISATPARPEVTAAITLDDLSCAIQTAWGADTSDDPDWSAENPALGQCAATALLVQELLGGEVLTANVSRAGRRVDRHAWNRLPSGLELDLTRSQYRDGEEFELPSLDVPVLVDRAKFRLLAGRVRALLQR